MTLESLLLIRRVLSGVTLSVGADDFCSVAPQMVAALIEVDALIAEAEI